MTDKAQTRRVVPIHDEFFCDGHYYLLTSSSLGGSRLTPKDISDAVSSGDEAAITGFLDRGICIPMVFDGDCALDSATNFVFGDLSEAESRDWIGRFAWKLNIPCGKFVLLAGGGDDTELAHAISGRPPQEHYVIFQVIDVPPGEYLVEVLAFFHSMTVQQSVDYTMPDWNFQKNPKLEAWYQENHPGDENVHYIVRMVPLEEAPPFPKLIPDFGWCGVFEFRGPADF